MRIALVSQEYPPETAKGGIGSQTYLKAHGLAQLGHDIQVLSRSPDASRYDYQDGPVRVTRLPAHRMAVYTEAADWVLHSTAVAQELAACHQRTPLDLIDFPEWGCEGYVHLLNRTEWNHIPTVIQLHGPLVMLAHTMAWPDLDSEFYRVGTHMEGTCLRLADAVFASSDFSADWCARHYGLNREAIPRLHTGVDTTVFCPGKSAIEDRPTLVFVGRIVPNKGVFMLLDAARRLVKEYPDLQLRLFGHGEREIIEKLKAQAAAGGIDVERLLDLRGFVNRDELPKELARGHLFVAPSECEGGPGFVFLEAMACGVPVIGCEGSGVAEVVKHGETGLLIPPGDLSALIDAIRRLLSNPDEREAMARRGRQYVMTEAERSRCVKNIAAFYGDVVGGKLSHAQNGSSND